MLCAIVVITRNVYAAAIAVLVVALAYAWAPRGYAISEGFLVIKRLIGDVRVPLASIREARAGTTDDFRGSLRLWGNGGLFGYYGLFTTTKLGKGSWYVTDRSKAVVVVTGAKTMVISPADRERFLASVGPPSRTMTRTL